MGGPLTATQCSGHPLTTRNPSICVELGFQHSWLEVSSRGGVGAHCEPWSVVRMASR